MRRAKDIYGASLRKKNPVSGFQLAAKNGEHRAYWTGEEFHSTKARGKIYATAAAALAVAGYLSKSGKRLKRGWRYVAVPAAHTNPVEPGARLYSAFHGEPHQRLKQRRLPIFRKGVEVGPLVAVVYDTVRDGKSVRYEHEFKPRASPLLIVSDDGRKLAATGGDFRFTDRGFVDFKK